MNHKINLSSTFIGLLILAIVVAFVLSGCNYDMVDTVYSYDYALAEMPGEGVRRIPVKSWRDYENGDQIQITDTEGTVYLFHSSDVVLVKDGKKNG